MPGPFHQKVIIITGASSGIGKALAEKALAEGAFVAACARDLEKLRVSFASAAADDRLLLHQADVSQKEDCRQFARAVLAKWQRIDWLINNAGISMRALFEEADLSVIERLMQVNFWGAVYMTKFSLPAIKEQKGGIVGISSIAGYRGLPGRAGYSASKFAMQGFLETLRTELLYTGVQVMWAAPGFTSSNIRNTALAANGEAQKETPLDESRLMSAGTCAQIIFDGMRKRKRTIVMTTQGKATVWLNKLFPGWMDKMVFNHFAKEPNSPIKKP
ncbi:MAG TPA: SDR family oxidoreductase [Edaphocola sp.]|nr:SDR family oxidoreductase [Edaphocola sp.]